MASTVDSSEVGVGGPATWPGLVLIARLVVAAVWLYEGLWLKVILQAPHELAVVAALPPVTSLSPRMLLMVIGVGETMLAVGVLSGLFGRPLAYFQAALLVLMNGLGIFFGGSAIPDPLGLIVHNLPLLVCIALLGWHGPGVYAWSDRRVRR